MSRLHQDGHTYAPGLGDLFLCLLFSPVVGTLGVVSPGAAFGLAALVAGCNGIRWGFEETQGSDLGRWFNPVAAIDGTGATFLYLLLLALVVPTPFLTCCGVVHGC